MSLTPSAAAERFATLLRALLAAVAERSARGRIAAPLILLIWNRINHIGQRFARLAARISAGTYRPRRSYRRSPSANPKPRQKSPLPQQFGWLLPLMPAIPELRGSAAANRYWLEWLFNDPEMQALLAAAPAEMGRILRPLCWMLGLKPPPILARPRRAPPQSEPPVAPPASKPTPARHRPPASPDAQDEPAPTVAVPSRACGPPHSD